MATDLSRFDDSDDDENDFFARGRARELADDGDGDGDGERERVHHGTFNVEGIVMDGELVLVDKKSKAVYSSTERLPNGEHVRIGTWDEVTQSYEYWKLSLIHI